MFQTSSVVPVSHMPSNQMKACVNTRTWYTNLCKTAVIPTLQRCVCELTAQSCQSCDLTCSLNFYSLCKIWQAFAINLNERNYYVFWTTLENLWLLRNMKIGLTFSLTPAVTVCPRLSSLPFPCQVTSAVSSPFLPKITQAWSSDSARCTSFRPRTWQAATTANATPELSSLVPGSNETKNYLHQILYSLLLYPHKNFKKHCEK